MSAKFSNNNSWGLNSTMQTGVAPSQGLRKFGTISTSKPSSTNATSTDSTIKSSNNNNSNLDHHHFILNG